MNDNILKEKFINDIRGYILSLTDQENFHSYAFMLTHFDHIAWLNHLLTEWNMPDRHFLNQDLERYKNAIIENIVFLCNLLSNPQFFETYNEKYRRAKKDETREIFREVEKYDYQIRKNILLNFDNLCKVDINQQAQEFNDISSNINLLIDAIKSAIYYKELDPIRLKITPEREFCDDIRAIIQEGVKNRSISVYREFPTGFAKKKIGETDFYIEMQLNEKIYNLAIGEVKKWGKFKEQLMQLIGYLNRHTMIGFTIVLNQNNPLPEVKNEMVRILHELLPCTEVNGDIIISYYTHPESKETVPIYHFIANAYCEERKQMALDARK